MILLLKRCLGLETGEKVIWHIAYELSHILQIILLYHPTSKHILQLFLMTHCCKTLNLNESYMDKRGPLAAGSWILCVFQALWGKQLMKDDPNYSCTMKPDRDFSNPISFNLPAAADSCPIRKRNLDRSRCLERSPNADNEFLLEIWHHLTTDAGGSKRRRRLPGNTIDKHTFYNCFLLPRQKNQRTIWFDFWHA